MKRPVTLLWGQIQHKEGKGAGNGFEWYWRATRWFHRMKHAGKLPPPYCDVAHMIPALRCHIAGFSPKHR